MISGPDDNAKRDLDQLRKLKVRIAKQLRTAERVAAGGDPDLGGGWNRKSKEDHLLDGTYRRDRHGPLTDGVLAWPEKPPTKITATVRSQSRWCRGEADRHAVRNGCRFNEPLAEYVCEFFAKFLRHSKGQWAGEPFELTDWQQREIVFPLFGWVRPDGTRRFRRSYIEIPKKNYKSTMAAGVGLYMLCGDGEAGAEVYSLGADRDQARVVHNEAVAMADASPELSEVLKINRSSFAISYPYTRSTYRAMSSSPRGKHGPNAHCCLKDELHEWYGDELWQAMKYAYRARRQPLDLVITNAGDNLESICYKQHTKARGILDGTIFDDQFFAMICCATREQAEAEVNAVADGQDTLPVAASCNPALGHVITEEGLLADVRDAIQTPSEMPNLLRLTYGIWEVNSDPWLNMADWAACGEDYTEADMEGQSCWLALDKSRTRDMTAIVALFPDGDEYRQLAWTFLPEATIAVDRRLVADMDVWVKDGHLIAVPGNVITDEVIETFLAEQIAPRFDVLGFVFDAMYAQGTAEFMEDKLEYGIETIVFPQTIVHFAGPTAAYEKLLIAGKMHHNNNPVFTWQAGHVQIKTDINDNRRPIKPRGDSHLKIDAIVAAVMDLGAAMQEEPEFEGGLTFAGSSG